MNRLQTISLVIATTITVSLAVVISTGARTGTARQFDAAANYKQCVACHGAKAEKKFDPANSDDTHIQIILKGKKMEKPPHMPGYESKGINAEQAKALLDYMKTLRG